MLLKIGRLFGLIRLVLYKIRFGKKLEVSSYVKCFIGKDSYVRVLKNSRIKLHKGVYFRDHCKIESASGNIEVGENSFFNSNCHIVSYEKIRIGKDCLFGPNVCIYDNDHSFSQKAVPINKQGFIIKPVSIGSNVWVGANVVITKGVIIGDNVVIGANSVVTKDLEPNGLYAGSPLRFIRKLETTN